MGQPRGHIVSVDGLWHIGKSAVCRVLARLCPTAVYLQEPDHIQIVNSIGDIELWYLIAWRKRMELASAHKRRHSLVILERSFFSTLAYLKARNMKISDQMEKCLEFLKQNLPDQVILLEVPIDYYAGLSEFEIEAYKKSGVFLDDRTFLSDYWSALKAVIERYDVPSVLIQARTADQSFDPGIVANHVIEALRRIGVLSS